MIRENNIETQLKCKYSDCLFKPENEEKYCFWHKKEDGKKVTMERFKELVNEALKSKDKTVIVSGGYFKKADFTEIDIGKIKEDVKIVFISSDFTEANFEGSKIGGIKFNFCYFKKANLKNVFGIFTDFSGSKFIKADFSHSDFSGTNFASGGTTQFAKQAIKRSVGFEDIVGLYTEIIQCRFDKTTLSGANFTSTSIYKSFFTAAGLEGSLFENTKVEENVIEKTPFTGSAFVRTLFKNNFSENCDFNFSIFSEIKGEFPSPLFTEENFLTREGHETVGDIILYRKYKKQFDVVLLNSLPIGVQFDLVKKGFVRFIVKKVLEPEVIWRPDEDIFIFYVGNYTIDYIEKGIPPTEEILYKEVGIFTENLRKIPLSDLVSFLEMVCLKFDKKVFLENIKKVISKIKADLPKDLYMFMLLSHVFSIERYKILPNIDDECRKVLLSQMIILQADRNVLEKNQSRYLQGNHTIPIVFYDKKKQQFVKNPFQEVGKVPSGEYVVKNALPYNKNDLKSYDLLSFSKKNKSILISEHWEAK